MIRPWTRHRVDGGLVSPVPVDAARQLGANFEQKDQAILEDEKAALAPIPTIRARLAAMAAARQAAALATIALASRTWRRSARAVA